MSRDVKIYLYFIIIFSFILYIFLCLYLISNVAEYSYYYNVDDMQTRVIVTWRNIDNIFLQKAKLIDFLKRMGPSLQNDCIWFFHDKSDYANNFQRYCIIEHRDSLQVEYFETIE